MRNLILISISALMAASCVSQEKYDTDVSAAYQKGLQEGKQVGTDSVKETITGMKKAVTERVVEALAVHPPYDGHVHTKTISASSTPVLGTMFLTLLQDHKPQFYLDFINNKGTRFMPADVSDPDRGIVPANHKHLEYDIVWVKGYDESGVAQDSVPLAVNVRFR